MVVVNSFHIRLPVTFSAKNNLVTYDWRIFNTFKSDYSNDSPVADELDLIWNSDFYQLFINTYWQKKPLFVRNAFPDIEAKLNLTRKDYFELSQDIDVQTRFFQKSMSRISDKIMNPYVNIKYYNSVVYKSSIHNLSY